MSRRPLTRAGAVAAVLWLAACAGEEPPATTAAAPSGAPGGDWVVTDVWGGGGRDPAGLDRLVGQGVRLDQAAATDPLGRSCDHPVWREYESTEAAFLGALDRAREFPALRRPVAMVEATCDGEPFGRYARWRDGSLMARLGHTVLRLAPAASVPAPVPAAVVAAPVAMPAAPAATSVPDRLVYLASFRKAAEVDRGWAQLKARSATLATLSPVTRKITLPGRGDFLRLFAAAHDEAEARRVCSELGRAVPDCDVDHGLGKATGKKARRH
ncbi:MAG: hypothetical protein ACM31L_01195 [Actinomycetota bacterium]